jgi:hypothetical protein
VREILNIVQWRCDIDVLDAEQIPLPIVKVDGCVVILPCYILNKHLWRIRRQITTFGDALMCFHDTRILSPLYVVVPYVYCIWYDLVRYLCVYFFGLHHLLIYTVGRATRAVCSSEFSPSPRSCSFPSSKPERKPNSGKCCVTGELLSRRFTTRKTLSNLIFAW